MNKRGNIIHQNYTQGIILEEGCAAVIVSNHLTRNIKANIALGGLNSEYSKVKFNTIERSKQEGIFCVEGGEGLDIDSNIILNNKDGLVLLHSLGTIQNNRIEDNDRCGIVLLSETNAIIETNKVENNVYGIDIKDPSEPVLRKNTVRFNSFQVSLEKNGKKRWDQYKAFNDISGPNDFPQGIDCNIF